MAHFYIVFLPFFFLGIDCGGQRFHLHGVDDITSGLQNPNSTQEISSVGDIEDIITETLDEDGINPLSLNSYRNGISENSSESSETTTYPVEKAISDFVELFFSQLSIRFQIEQAKTRQAQLLHKLPPQYGNFRKHLQNRTEIPPFAKANSNLPPKPPGSTEFGKEFQKVAVQLSGLSTFDPFISCQSVECPIGFQRIRTSAQFSTLHEKFKIVEELQQFISGKDSYK